MDKSHNQSTCPVCGGEFRLGWRGFGERWPRWLAVFFGACLTLAIWVSAGQSRIDPREIRLAYGFSAALGWFITFYLWVLADGGHDARQHKACVPRTRQMWLVPPLLALASALGAVAAGGAVYAAVWGLQYLRHYLAG